MASTRSGWLRFHASPQLPCSNPENMSCVPIAPSPSKGRSRLTSCKSFFIYDSVILKPILVVPERSELFPEPGPICDCGCPNRNSNPPHWVCDAMKEQHPAAHHSAASRDQWQTSGLRNLHEIGTWLCVPYRREQQRNAAPVRGNLRNASPASHDNGKPTAAPCWCKWFRHSGTTHPASRPDLHALKGALQTSAAKR